MTSSIKGFGGTTAPSVTSSTQRGGTLTSTASKMQGEAQLLQQLTALTAPPAAAPAQQTADGQSTQKSRQDVATEAVTKTLTDYKGYLEMSLGETGAAKVSDTIKAKVDAYIKANPNASDADIEKVVKDTFNNESLGAKIFKDILDKMLQETLDRIRKNEGV